MKTKRLSALLLTVMTGVMLAFAVKAENVDYLFYDEVTGTMKRSFRTTYNTLTEDMSAWGNGNWYVADGNIDIYDRVTVSGDAYLILKNGCTLNVRFGISVPQGSSLTVYGNSEDTYIAGSLIANASNRRGAAGIGGSDGCCGDVTICGGNVTAIGFEGFGHEYSGGGAGIGGGGDNGTDCGNITIYGGTVIANGGDFAAGIGCSGYASASEYDSKRNTGTVTIVGGHVTATGDVGAMGVGSGFCDWYGTTNILGGSLSASGGYGAVVRNIFGFGSKYSTLNVGEELSLYRTDDGSLIEKGEGQKWRDLLNGENISFTAEPKLPPVDPTPVSQDVTYLAYDTETGKFTEQTHEGCTVMTEDMTALPDGWYVVWGTLDMDGIVTTDGDVHMILTDGCRIDVPSFEVTGSLSIYAQSVGRRMGRLFAEGVQEEHAGIRCTGATVNIHGGRISAKGGPYAAGIGGNYSGNGGDVNIYGGYVTAEGGEFAAGIGGGDNGGSGRTDIRGGEVLAVGGVTNPSGSNRAAGIGRGYGAPIYAANNDPTISEGLSVADRKNRWYITADRVKFTSSVHIFPTVVRFAPVTYMEYSERYFYRRKCTEYYTPRPDCDVLEGAWYVIDGKRTFDGALTVNGDVKLILEDGCELYTGGIIVNKGSSLTIYAGEEGTGTLTAVGGKFYAGIGGGDEKECGNIVIHGGIISATGGFNAAGIGGGAAGDGGNVTVYGGEVTATGGEGGAGIGSGISGNGGSVTILGGKVTATGGSDEEGIYGAAGIGSGGRLLLFGEYDSAENGFRPEGTATAGNIIIRGGEVYANGGAMSAGIGGGTGCDAGNVEISGGVVTANGGSYASGIGSGWCECMDEDFYSVTVRVLGGNVSITGGDVTDNGRLIYCGKHDFTDSECIDCGDGLTHERVCKKCGATVREAHDESGAVCSCGAVRYLDYDPLTNTRTVRFRSDCEVIDVGHKITEWEDGKWYAAVGRTGLDEIVKVTGEVHLILTEKARLNLNGGIQHDGGHLYIHAQTQTLGETLSCARQDAFPGIDLLSLTLIDGNVETHGAAVEKPGAGGIITQKLTVYGGRFYAKVFGFATKTFNGGIALAANTLDVRGGEVLVFRGIGNVSETIWTQDCCLFGDVSVKNEDKEEYTPLPVGEDPSVYPYLRITPHAGSHTFDSGILRDNGDGTHSERCRYCTEAYGDPEAHTGSDGDRCGCGAVWYNAYDEKSGKIVRNFHSGCIVIDENHKPTAWSNGEWYIVEGYERIDSVTVSGEVHLILPSYSNLLITGDISGDGHLYIHGQHEMNGKIQLTCSGADGNTYGDCDGGDGISLKSLTVDSCYIYAVSGKGGYGEKRNGGNGGCAIRVETLKVNDARVMALGARGGDGDDDHAGGRGGNGVAAKDVYVTGGELVAMKGEGGAHGRMISGRDTIYGKAFLDDCCIHGEISVSDDDESEAFVPLEEGDSMDDHLYVRVTKEIIPFTVEINDRRLGSVEVSPKKLVPGETVTLTAIPNEGCRFVGFSSEDVALSTDGRTAYFTADENLASCSVSAVFAELDHLSVSEEIGIYMIHARGEHEFTGIIAAALYDTDTDRLIEVKVYDLSKGDIPRETVTKSGLLRVFWLDGDSFKPYCEPCEEEVNRYGYTVKYLEMDTDEELAEPKRVEGVADMDEAMKAEQPVAVEHFSAWGSKISTDPVTHEWVLTYLYQYDGEEGYYYYTVYYNMKDIPVPIKVKRVRRVTPGTHVVEYPIEIEGCRCTIEKREFDVNEDGMRMMFAYEKE